jgi:hypothetical protein
VRIDCDDQRCNMEESPDSIDLYMSECGLGLGLGLGLPLGFGLPIDRYSLPRKAAALVWHSTMYMMNSQWVMWLGWIAFPCTNLSKSVRCIVV